jgi:outer membrane protein TolC
MTASRRPRANPAWLAASLAMLCTSTGCISSRSMVEPAPAPDPLTAIPAPGSTAPAGLAPVAIDQDAAHAWTAADCLAYAWTHNRAISRARWRIIGAQATVEQADADYLPTIKADGSGSTRNNDSGINFEGLSFVTGNRSVATGDVLATVPLFGIPLGRRAGAHHGLLGARADIDQVRADVAYAIERAMTDVREARLRVDLMASSISTLAAQAAIAEDRQRAGLAFATDVLADQVRLSEREQDRLHAQNDVAMALGHLDRLLGLPLDRTLILSDEQGQAPAATDENALTLQALARRQDLTAARERLQQSMEGIRDAQTSYLPQANLVAGYYVTTDTLVLNRQWFGASLNVTVPLLDSGTVAAQVDGCRARVGEQSEAVNELVDAIREEVHDALLDLREADARLPVVTKSRDLARLRMAQVQDQYRQGLADMTTLLAAENDAVTSQLQELHARFDARRAGEQLAHAIHAPTAASAP